MCGHSGTACKGRHSLTCMGCALVTVRVLLVTHAGQAGSHAAVTRAAVLCRPADTLLLAVRQEGSTRHHGGPTATTDKQRCCHASSCINLTCGAASGCSGFSWNCCLQTGRGVSRGEW